MRARGTAKLGGKHHECFIEQGTTIKIIYQTGNGMIDGERVFRVIPFQAAVSIPNSCSPCSMLNLNEPHDETPSDDAIHCFDNKRKNKTVSNDDWVSKSDLEAAIAKMKDGTTHLAYKTEHVVDLESEIALAATIHPANHGDMQTIVDSVIQAQVNLDAADF